MKKILLLLLVLFSLFTFIPPTYAARGDNCDEIICFEPSIASDMLLELQRCRVDKQVIVEQQEKIRIQRQIIEGQKELLKIKDEIISLKDDQINTLKATEVVKTLSDVVNIQGDTIRGMRTSGLLKVLGVVATILTFGLIL